MITKRLVFSVVALISSLVLSVSTLQAAPTDDKGKSGGGKKKNNDSVNVELGISATISAGISIGDARVLASKHGITDSKPLPPGIKKNLARGKPMPPGIRKTRMPQSFINELPRHDGYEWQQAGADLVLIVSGSLIISDILEGVFD
jgi:hypothetical protein